MTVITIEQFPVLQGDKYISHETRFTTDPETVLWVPVDFDPEIPLGTTLGQIDFTYDPCEKRLEVDGFYPFGQEDELFHQFIGKRLADRIELLICRNLLKELSPETTISNYSPNNHRENQLRRHGLDVNERYLLAQYTKAIANTLGF